MGAFWNWKHRTTEDAQRALSAFCTRRGHLMTVPVDFERDADCILDDVIAQRDAFLPVITACRGEKDLPLPVQWAMEKLQEQEVVAGTRGLPPRPSQEAEPVKAEPMKCFFCDDPVYCLPNTCKRCGAKLTKLVMNMTAAELIESCQRNGKITIFCDKAGKAESTLALAV